MFDAIFEFFKFLKINFEEEMPNCVVKQLDWAAAKYECQVAPTFYVNKYSYQQIVAICLRRA